MESTEAKVSYIIKIDSWWIKGRMLNMQFDRATIQVELPNDCKADETQTLTIKFEIPCQA